MPNSSSPKFRVSLRLANLTYTKIASSVIEALEKMQPEHLSKTKGVISVTSKGKKAEALLWPPQLKRLFINKTAKVLFQKRMIGAMK